MAWKLSKLFNEASQGEARIVPGSSSGSEGCAESNPVHPDSLLGDPWCKKCGADSRSVVRTGTHVHCLVCGTWERLEPADADFRFVVPNRIEEKFGPPYRTSCMPTSPGFKDVFSGGSNRAMMQVLFGRRGR